MKQSRRFVIIMSMVFLLSVPALSNLARTLGLNSSVIDLSHAYAQEVGVTPSPTLATAPVLFPSAQAGIQGVNVSPGVIRSRPVTINTAALPVANTQVASTSLDTLTFNLFDDAVFTGQKIRIEPNQLLPDGYVWVGAIPGDPYSQVILSVGGGQIEASIQTADSMYQITYGGNGVHLAQQLDPASLISTLDDVVVPPVRTNTASTDNLDGAQINAQSVYIIDLMVVYTTNAKNAQGGVTAMQNGIQAAVAAANQAYVNSGINLRLKLVNTTEVTYTETGNMSTDLTRLQVTNDGFIDNVHTLRNTYNADLVTLVTNEDSNTTGVCGLGYLFTPPLNTGFAPYGFNIVTRQCMAGGRTMAHELGHNMGAAHDAANAGGQGAYAYSYGYQDPQGRLRDIMGYMNGCSYPCPSVNYFSNQTRTLNGIAIGSASADTATTLNNTASIVAQFRGTAPQVQITPTPNATLVVASPPPNPTSLPGCSINVAAANPTALVNAINTANGNGASNDVICLAASSTYTFTSGPYDEGDGPSALPSIDSDITILGNNATLTRSGSNQFRFLYINFGGELSIDSLKLTNGRYSPAGLFAAGGAIMNIGTLTVANSTFTANFANNGGAIFTFGGADIKDSTFLGNGAQVGGAIAAGNIGSTRYTNIQRTIFKENIADNGSAIFADSYQGAPSNVQVSVNGSCFIRNTNFAVDISDDDPAADVNAANNWWNSSGGPTLSDGTVSAGDGVVVGEVIYQNYLTWVPSYCDPTAPTPEPPGPTPAPIDAAPLRNFFTTGAITLTWGRVTTAQIYEVQVSTTNGFAAGTIVFTRNDLTANTLSVLISPDLTDGTYYWHVRGCQGVGVGCGNWSITDSFVVDIP